MNFLITTFVILVSSLTSNFAIADVFGKYDTIPGTEKYESNTTGDDECTYVYYGLHETFSYKISKIENDAPWEYRIIKHYIEDEESKMMWIDFYSDVEYIEDGYMSTQGTNTENLFSYHRKWHVYSTKEELNKIFQITRTEGRYFLTMIEIDKNYRGNVPYTCTFSIELKVKN